VSAPAAEADVESTAWIVDELHRDLVAADPQRWTERSPGAQRAALVRRTRELSPLLGSAATLEVVERVLARITGLGPLEPLLDDEDVTEVMVNGDGSVWIERRGQVTRTGLSLDGDTVLRIIERIVAPLGRRIDRSSPTVDARLPDGSRVNAIVPPAAVDGPCLTIRRFGARRLQLESFAGPGVAQLLRWAVRARSNVVVSGGTGSGKTTLLNALAAVLPEGDRVITIEDTAELRLATGHVVRLESRAPNAEGSGALPLRDLVRNALRMRPDRIVVGEVRGAEVLDMLAAMNTGHEGSMSTVHANSPADALRRLESMAVLSAADVPIAVVRDLLASAVDLIVQITRGAGGGRHVTTVHEVRPVTGADPVGAPRTRSLVEAGRLTALPQRPPRAPEAIGPLHDWIGK
jgi:pilus assembly protein CpaF